MRMGVNQHGTSRNTNNHVDGIISTIMKIAFNLCTI